MSPFIKKCKIVNFVKLCLLSNLQFEYWGSERQKHRLMFIPPVIDVCHLITVAGQIPNSLSCTNMQSVDTAENAGRGQEIHQNCYPW